MNDEWFAKLKLLKRVIGRMSITDKIAYVSAITDRLASHMLKTADGNHAFSTENILSVTLAAVVTDSRREFEAICGCYGGGYQSALRQGLYHGKGDISISQWRKEIRRLYHNIKENMGNLQLPSFGSIAE